MHEGTSKALEGGINYKLGALAEEVRALNQWLRGNGKVGVIQELRLDVDVLKQQKLEHSVRQQTLQWGFRLVGGLLIWSWGALMGASSWLPRLHAFLKALGW